MADSTRADRNADDTPEKPPRRNRTRRSTEWVEPRLLIAFALALLIVSTVVVVLRNHTPPKRRSAPISQDTTTARAVPRRPPTSEIARTAPVPLGPVVTGTPDRSDAKAFHAKFSEALPKALRLIGFRPALVESVSDTGGYPARWTIRVPVNFPVLRVNAEATRVAEAHGGTVYRAMQDSTDRSIVRLWIGAGNTVTDELELRIDRRLKFLGSLAIVIDDVGYRPVSETREFLTLPYALTLSILPHHPGDKEIARDAVAAGKDVIVHLPMQPDEPNPNMEPNTIMTTMSDDRIKEITSDDLDAVPGIVGVNNHMGSKATADPRVMRDVLTVLNERGLFFLDSRTTAATVAEKTAREMGIRTGRRNVFLDNNRSIPKIVQQIYDVAKVATHDGHAIAIGHDREQTYRALAEALPRLEAEGYRICRLDELMR